MGYPEGSAELVPAKVAPFARGVIDSRGKLFIHEWTPVLFVTKTEESAYREVAASGTKVFDLVRVAGEDDHPDAPNGLREVFAVPVTGTVLSQSDLNLIIGWAESTGYHRIWFGEDGTFRELSGHVAFGSTAVTECAVCGSVMVDHSFNFWSFVASRGRFPSSCGFCGSKSLPQWTVLTSEPDLSPGKAADSDLFPTEWDGPWASANVDGDGLEADDGDQPDGDTGDAT